MTGGRAGCVTKNSQNGAVARLLCFILPWFDFFTMPFTGNLLQVDQLMAGPALFLRVQHEVPALVESPELLTLLAPGTWQPVTPA